MKFKLCMLLVFATQYVLGQQPIDSSLIDSRYREDQFYFSITYNLLIDKPNNLSQSGFSSGFHFGFIRDMPINKRRNLAVGLGLGLSTNSYNQNMLIDKSSTGQFNYSILDKGETPYTRNKFTTYLVELPIEFRWRTSTATANKFWRIYPGLRVGYVFANSSKIKFDSDKIKHANNPDFNDLQYGFTLSAGYETWNFCIYYGLNPIFKDQAKIEDTTIELSNLKIGLNFYIL